MIQLKEFDTEKMLQQKVKQLEQLLDETKQELHRVNAYNEQLELIVKGSGQAKVSKVITIKSASKIEFVAVKDIICCTADIGYTDIQLQDGRIITATKPLSKFEDILSPYSFFRISKSHIINTAAIITFHKDRNQILLQGNTTLNIARRRRVDFLKVFR